MDNSCNRRTKIETNISENSLRKIRLALGTSWFFPSIKFVKFLTRIEFEPAIAAAVLLVGKFVQSPMAKTLGYFLCCNVSLTTSTKPLASDRGDFIRKSCGCIGAPICKKSYWIRPKKKIHQNKFHEYSLSLFSLFQVDRDFRKSPLSYRQELRQDSSECSIEYFWKQEHVIHVWSDRTNLSLTISIRAAAYFFTPKMKGKAVL